jgi:hypothetical protein
MREMLAYRFVLLSYVDAVRASSELQALAAEQLARRRQRHDLLLKALARAGYLDRRAALARTDLLFEQGELISSGWLNAATVRGWRDDEETIRHFAKVGVALLEPCCTPRGARIYAASLRRPRPRGEPPPEKAHEAPTHPADLPRPSPPGGQVTLWKVLRGWADRWCAGR